MPGLQTFSDWTLSLLPRLFLYPGGLWMLAGLVLLRLAWAGRAGVAPVEWARTLARANLGALTTAWVALALSPLPGASALSVPVDTFALVGLLVVSLAFDLFRGHGPNMEEALAGAAITLALLAPLAGAKSLLPAGEGPVAGWLALLAVLVALLARAKDAGQDLSGGVRWLAWLGLAASPLWSLGLPVEGIYWTSGVYLVGIAALTLAAKAVRAPEIALVAAAWAVSVLALLVALVGL